jgi:hypothetical protein
MFHGLFKYFGIKQKVYESSPWFVHVLALLPDRPVEVNY